MTTRLSLTATLMTSSMLAALPMILPLAAHAQASQTVSSGKDDTGIEVIVTATKRATKLQDTPISIEVLSTKKLDELNVASFNDYVALLPSVTFQNTPYQGSNVYFRGVASGGDGNHSGPQPSVGIYLDEEPVTTIGGPLDVHIYDMARIESLAGPQGTLYGASSEAGTIRLITNKPDTGGYYGRIDVDANTVDHGGQGGKLEGMINIPFSDKVALRVVGWEQHNAGFIDNIAGTRSFLPAGSGITVDNAPYVKNNYNTSEIEGARAALKVDLDENWTVTGSVIGQATHAKGSAGYDPNVGDLEVQHFLPEYNHDRFIQAALTVQGKIGNFDLTYAGAAMKRTIDSAADYTDYAEAYDRMYESVGGNAGYFYFWNAAGDTIAPLQEIIGHDVFTKTSHELRLASPSTDRLRFVAGVFYQRQTHDILQNYEVAGLDPNLSVEGWPGTLWLTKQMRIDRDKAVFGEVSYDFTPKLTLTAGLRAFEYDNTLIGFFGFGSNDMFRAGDDFPPNAVYGSSGERRCLTTDTYGAVNPKDPTGTLLPGLPGTPCTDLGVQNADGSISPKEAKDNGFTHKLNLSWKATPDAMLYATWSKGFRPGGINRRSTIAPYAPDYLTNYELGYKLTLLNKTLRINGAVYDQTWDAFQFAFLGANSFTEVHNGPSADIKGLESDLTWAPDNHLTIAASGSYTDASLTKNLCTFDGDSDPNCAGVVNTYETQYPGGVATLITTPNQDFIAAPKGTRLPVTPKVKLSASARYNWEIGDIKPYWQVLANYQSKATSDLRTHILETFTGADLNPAVLSGGMKAYATINLAFGAEWHDKWTAELYIDNLTDERAQLSRYQECGMCFQRSYIVTNTPRTFGVRLGGRF
jgi:outer membrane receptor protein involved in Fe transport